jgi:hypothetical protein
MASVIYLVTPELFAHGVQAGKFVDDTKGIAPAWFQGDLALGLPPGPIHVNPSAR